MTTTSSRPELLYRPAPRVVTIVAIAMLLAIATPPVIFAPQSAGLVFGELVALAFAAFLAALVRRRVHLSVDEAGATLVVRDLRWPLAPRGARVPLAEIEAVRVARARSLGDAGPADRVEIVLRGGAIVPVTDSYWGPSERHAVVARTLEEWGGARDA